MNATHVHRLHLFVCEPWFAFHDDVDEAIRMIYGMPAAQIDGKGHLAHHPALRMVDALHADGTWMEELCLHEGSTYNIHYPDVEEVRAPGDPRWGQVDVFPGTLTEVPELTPYEVERFILLLDLEHTWDAENLRDLVRECLV